MTSERRKRLAQQLVMKMTDLGNELGNANRDLDFAEISNVCTAATIHVLCTFVFSKLNEEGLERGDEILAKIVESVVRNAKETMADRRIELEEGLDEDDDDGDPWEEDETEGGS